MQFRYTLDTNRIESSDPAVFVQFLGYLPGRKLGALHYQDKKIGFFLATDRPSPELITVEPGVRVHVVLSLCEQITKVRDGKSFVKVPIYRFADRNEQNEMVELLLSALRNYDGAKDKIKEGSVAVCLSPMAKEQIELGALLSK